MCNGFVENFGTNYVYNKYLGRITCSLHFTKIYLRRVEDIPVSSNITILVSHPTVTNTSIAKVVPYIKKYCTIMMGNIEYTQIKDLKAGMKNINAVFIVLDVGPPTLTKEAREVRTLRVADATASVNLSVWDAPGALLQPGDIVRLLRGYASPWRSALTLYSGKTGDIQKVDEFCMLFNEQVNMSEPQPTPPLPATLAPPAGAMSNASGKTGGYSHDGNKPAAGGGGGGGGGASAAHKTYVRGRGGHARGAARR